MQCKVLLTSLMIALGAAPAMAQHKAIVKKPAAANGKSDSTGIRSKGTLLASNAVNRSYNPELLSYGHVPLAGEKAYFGEMNEYVNDFVRKYMEAHNRTLSSVQNNSAQPFSVIDNVLEQKKMPKELKYLAVIESALNHKAVSHAGAVGPWQMMETTAKMMGLKVSRKNDERTDWGKSTDAATKYLDLLYSQLNDWLLVVAAYNSGPTPVLRAIEKTGSHNFWDIKEYLPRETQGHVLAFIATASIFENLSKFISLGSIPVDFKFGKDSKEDEAMMKELIAASAPGAMANAPKATAPTAATPAKPAVAGTTPAPAPALVVVPKKVTFTDEELKNMNILKVDQPISLDVMAVEIGLDKKLMTRWNPDYDQFMNHTYATPYYKLRIPKDKTDLFLQKKDLLVKRTATAGK
jgi:membrane-bound lytic murein transglycosylase D